MLKIRNQKELAMNAIDNDNGIMKISKIDDNDHDKSKDNNTDNKIYKRDNNNNNNHYQYSNFV